MGIEERVEGLRQQERKVWEKQKARDDLRATKMAQLYERQLPEAIKTQKALFEELAQMGVISMLEEMTGGPSTIRYPYTAEPKIEEGDYQSSTYKKFNSQFLFGTDGFTPLNFNVKERVRERGKNPQRYKVEWHAAIEGPKQGKTGKLDPTLTIQFKKFHRIFPPHSGERKLESSVIVIYSPNKILTISGEKEVFNQPVNKDSINHAELETAFAKAFHRPKPEPVERPYSEPNLPRIIGSGAK